MNSQDEILIENYLLGKLAPEELNAVEERIKSDIEFSNALESEKRALGAIHFAGKQDLRATLNRIHQESENELDEEKIIDFIPNSTQKRSNLYAWIGIAAVIALLIFIGLNVFFQTPDPQTLFAENYVVYEPNSGFRGDQGIPQYQMAIEKYKTGDYLGALSIFREISSQFPDHTLVKGAEMQILKGICCVQTEQYELAISEFQCISPQSISYYDQAQWYLSLTYLKTKDIDKAIAGFQRIAADSGSDFSERAGEILKGLK